MAPTISRMFDVSVALLLFLAGARAQAPADALQALRAMEVDGATTFSRDRLAAALANDGTTMRLLQQPLDDAAAAAIAHRIRALHRRAGHAHAEATGTVVDGVLHVALEAGARYRCGEVRCTGNTALSTAALRERLAAKPKVSIDRQGTLATGSSRTWVPGKFPVMDARATSHLQALVVDAYREIGRYGVRAAVEFVAEDERIVPVVTIADEGREVRVGSLRLHGEDERDAAAVLAGIDFRPGMPASTSAIAHLQRELEATGRYVDVTTRVGDEAPGDLDPLVFRVELRPRVPAPGSFAARDVAQVRAAIAAITRRLERGDVLQLVFTNTEACASGKVELLPGTATLRVGLHGVSFAADHLRLGATPAVKAFLGFTRQQAWVTWGGHTARAAFTAPADIRLRFATLLAKDGEMDVQWGASFHTRDTGGVIDIALHPATAMYILERADGIRRDGDDLELRFGDRILRLSPDGASVDGNLVLETAVSVAQLSWCSDLSEPQAFKANAGPLVETMLVAAFGLAADLLQASGPEDARLVPLVRGIADAATNAIAGSPDRGDHEEAEMPAFDDGPSKSPLELIAIPLAGPATRRWGSSALTELSAAFHCALRGDRQAAAARFSAMLEVEHHGPLSFGIAARVWSLLGNEDAASSFRRLAGRRWSFDAIHDNAARFGADLPALAGLPARIGATWRTAPGLAEGFADLPAGEAGDILAFRRGLELLWDSGGSAWLHNLLLGP